jgi:hypothetical protein
MENQVIKFQQLNRIAGMNLLPSPEMSAKNEQWEALVHIPAKSLQVNVGDEMPTPVEVYTFKFCLQPIYEARHIKYVWLFSGTVVM